MDRLTELRRQIVDLDDGWHDREMPDEVRARRDRLNDEYRDELSRGVAGNEFGMEEGATFANARPIDSSDAKTRALQTIDRENRSGLLTAAAADRLDGHVRSRDPLGLDAAYLAAVADPAYERAFVELLKDPGQGHLRFGPDEVAAVQRVTQIDAQRGMVGGTGSAGGFALPITIDASIILSSSGVLNPIREIARVITVGTREWRGVSSAGVTASYDPEASEVSDDTPTLAQPTIVTAMGRAFVPFSIELDDDWDGLAGELLRLVSDARDVLDATAFLTGTGTNEPAGILTGLTTSQRIQTATVAVYAVADPWTFKSGLPARFVGNSSFMANPVIWDTTYRFVAAGSTAEPKQFDDGRGGTFLGRPRYEISTMVSTTTTGSKIMVGGDFAAGFTIADRIGMSAELIPHLFGASQRPTGQRGFFARWRTGSAVVNANALRYLEVK